jgi:hypothetical protein
MCHMFRRDPFQLLHIARQVRYRGLKNREIEKILLRERLTEEVQEVQRTRYNLRILNSTTGVFV